MAVLEDEFGDVIRKARLGLELSLDAVAYEVGIPVTDLTAWEKYQGGPSPDVMARLAKRLGLPADRLEASLAEAFVPAEPPATIGETRLVCIPVTDPDSGYVENCYLWRWHDGLVVIDPGFEAPKILQAIAAAGVPVLGYLITHHHDDHIDALPELHKRHPAPIWVNHLEQGPLVDRGLAGALQILQGGETLTIGNHTVTTLPTPGHTAGGTTYRIPGLAAVGDVLFAGSVGRTFMGPGGYEILLHSVRETLLGLPGETVLCPGHGPMSTVAEERRHNPFAISV